jgi:NAD(P)-dependent dehydrogenase (short-subunit alcohol dehydrogenase family)
MQATKALASEFGKDQIRVNAICPLLAGTQLFEAFVGVPGTEENKDAYAKAVPLGRLAEPTDVAAAALYLAGDSSKFVTGVLLEVDGGKSI